MCRGPGAEGSWKAWLSRVVAELRAAERWMVSYLGEKW